MQDSSDRFKRRRLDGVELDDLSPLAHERMLQAAAGANDLTSLLLRQRLWSADQPQQEAGLASTLALRQQLARPGDASMLMGGGDAVVARMRQTFLNQQIQQASRIQAAEDLGLLRAPEPASSSSMYAASLLSSSRPLSNSHFLEQALGNETAAAAAARRGPVVSPEQLRALQMQSLLETGREEAAVLAASAVENRGGIRNLQASLLARHLQNERVMASAGMGAASFCPGGLQNLLSRAPAGAVTSALDHEVLMAQGARNFLGLPVSGAGGVGGMPPGQMQNNKKRAAPQANPNTTGRQPIHLFMSCDMDDLSPYQCLVRKQIELFEAQDVDAETNARGRNRPIVVGQVGIRCKHCKMLPPRKRERAAIYYPSKLDRLYQAGQTMASVHLGQHCNHIPEHLRQELARLREGKSAALAGKKYWSDGARALGVVEDDDRLFFRKD